MSLKQYYLLGRSGLRVSRLALGTMTFGNDGPFGAWGTSEETSRAILGRYLESGGNFLDTADFYGAGTSEALLGKFLAESGLRDRVVVASKFSNNLQGADPNGGGNGRKNMIRSVEASLRRLRTDYVDLYLVHTWDRITPVEEVVRAFDDLVRSGKVRHVGLSDVPAWYAARAQTYAEAHALTPPISLQLPYSLIERSLEYEFTTMAPVLGMGITAWSPLGMGLLSGKYRSAQGGGSGDGRLTQELSQGLNLFTEANWRVVAVLEDVAQTLGRSMAQVALNWAATQPGVASTIIGASKLSQLDDNLQALDFEIPTELRTKLNEVGAPAPAYPYKMFSDQYQAWILNAGVGVGDKPAGYSPPIWSPAKT